MAEAGNNLPQGVATAPVAKKVDKKIVYEFEGDFCKIQAEDLKTLEEILLKENDLQPKTYSISYMENDLPMKIKNQNHFAMFINGEPNQGNVYRIAITRVDDKPKPDNQQEPKPMPVNK